MSAYPLEMKTIHNYKLIVASCLIATVVHAEYKWQSVQFRGGGYVPEVLFHPKVGGPAYARTDVGGAYRLDPSNGKDWISITDSFTDGNDMGSIGIGLDPEDTNYVYLTGGLYTSLSWCGAASFLRSADRGATWTKITLGQDNIAGTKASALTGNGNVCFAGNGQGRGMGSRIAVKGAMIYLGTNQNGLLRSTDRGDTWTTVAALGDSTAVGAVVLDSAGNVYAAPSTGGLWKSPDGLAWTQIDSLTDVIYQMKYSRLSHSIWLTANKEYPMDQGGTGDGSVWKYNITSQTFTSLTMPSKEWNGYTKNFGYGAVALDPTDSNRVIVVSNGWWRCQDNPRSPSTFAPCEAMYQSRDGGKTWTDILLQATFDTVSAAWAASSNPGWITALAIDPSNVNHIIFGSGAGVWSTTNAKAELPTWYFTDQGLEETVPLGAVSPTYGAPLVSVMGDVNGAYHASLTVPPARPHDVDVGTNYDISVAALAQKKMIRIYKSLDHGLGGWSEDGGKSWTEFASHPPVALSDWGSTSETNFAALSADGSSIVWNMQSHGVYWSKDKGNTWTKSLTDSSLLTTPDVGFRVLADPVTPGVFYINNPKIGQFFQSTDHGVSWSATNGELGRADWWAYQYFRAFVSPKAAGEIWFTQANAYIGAGSNVVFRSTDAGKTLTQVEGISFATAIAFGKGKTPGIPAIYVAGERSDFVKGLFRSIDDGATWDRIDEDAHQYGGFGLLVGDPCVFSRVYVGGGAGRGILFAEESGNPNTCPDRIDYTPGSVTDIPNHFPISQVHLHRKGNSILASGNAIIRLTDLRGQEVRIGKGEMDLRDLPRGIYLATVGRISITVAIAR